MVKFSFENLNLSEMLDYITKLETDIKMNDEALNYCRNYIEGVNIPQYPNETDEEYRIRNIKKYFLDKLNKTNLMKYSRKQKQLKKKLEDLEIYLIDIGVIRINLQPDEEEIEQDNN